MSQDDECCEHPENGSCGHVHSEARDPCCESASVSGRKCDEACGGHEVHVIIYVWTTDSFLKQLLWDFYSLFFLLQEKNEDCCEPESENITVGLECKTNTHIGCCNHAADVKDQECFDDSVTYANKDVSFYFVLLFSSLQLYEHVIVFLTRKCIGN